MVSRPVWRLREGDARLRFAAPNFGHDNHRVLSGIVGLSDDEIAALAEAGVIGTVPRG